MNLVIESACLVRFLWFQVALNDLKSNGDITIKIADRGRQIVILDKKNIMLTVWKI